MDHVINELTPKQERFCQHYTVYWNATRAAKEAGYSEATAMEQGYQLLQKTSVQDRISQLSEHSLRELGIRRERVLRELAALAFIDIRDVLDDGGQVKPLKDIPENVRRTISSLEVNEIFTGHGDDKHAIGLTKRIKFSDKLKALELLGKHLKLFADRVEHSGPDGKPIEIKNSDLTDEQLDAKIAALLANEYIAKKVSGLIGGHEAE